MPAGMITERYEYIAGNSRKFWECDYPELYSGLRKWIVRFGRIGTQGQRKEFVESETYFAIRKAKDKAAEKLSKGYQQVEIEEVQLTPKAQATLLQTPHGKAMLAKANAALPLDEQTKQIVITLLKAGHPDDKIAEFAQCKVGQVKAIRAHLTMGKYDGLKPAGEPATSSKALASKALPSGKRRFNLK